MTIKATIKTRARVTVDPNSASRLHPDWVAAGFEDADRLPEVGESVLAVQPEDDAPDYVGTAVVKLLDLEHKLLYLDVDWDSFVDEVVQIASEGFEVQHSFGFMRSRPPLIPGFSSATSGQPWEDFAK